MGGNGSPRAEVRTNLGTYSQGVALGCYVLALSGHRHAGRMMRSPVFGLKGQPLASPGQRPVYYAQPCNLVPTLPRGNAVFDAPASDRFGRRRTAWNTAPPRPTAAYYHNRATSFPRSRVGMPSSTLCVARIGEIITSRL
jgi:hypothetical protein